METSPSPHALHLCPAADDDVIIVRTLRDSWGGVMGVGGWLDGTDVTAHLCAVGQYFCSSTVCRFSVPASIPYRHTELVSVSRKGSTLNWSIVFTATLPGP